MGTREIFPDQMKKLRGGGRGGIFYDWITIFGIGIRPQSLISLIADLVELRKCPEFVSLGISDSFINGLNL